MSETDDTDLLLLIPPDFFLVRSPDIDDFDSDYDNSFGFDHDEIKDAIVSDLITQVNYLESRVCMIENVDRSATHCSMCNENSFINQSENSLTESDVLRNKIKEQSVLLPRDTLNANLMIKSLEQDLESATSSVIYKHLSCVQDSPSDLIPCDLGSPTVVTNQDNILSDTVTKSNLVYIDTKNQVVTETNKSVVQLGLKENPTDLLSEVDTFLGTKSKQKVNPLSDIDLSGSSGLKIDLQRRPTANDSVVPLMSVEFISENNFNPGTEHHDLKQSLALPEVYQLLKEMEETQCEIEKKLKLRESQLLHTQKTNDDTTVSSRTIENSNKIHTAQILGLEELYTKPMKPGCNKQTENILERLKNIQGSKCQSINSYGTDNNTNQLSYLYSQTPPVLNEELLSFPKDTKVKSVSPSRNLVSRNPIDIVKANISRKDASNKSIVSQLVEDKGSSSRSTGYRRHLNFERPDLSIRTANSRPSLYTELSTINQSDIHRKNESVRLNVDLSQRTNSKSNYSLEQKLNSVTMQRNTTDKVNQNVPFGVENKPSISETLHQKLSSNNLLSLSELWNKEPTFYSDDPNKLRQKLEEEKYRRQHCEQQIQMLQLRVLEEQEKLAVAINVDQEKDKVIFQITESWRKLNDHWNELEEQRHSLAQQLQKEQESAKNKSDELTKKVERWEKEVSQALDLAAGYKDKSETLQKQLESLRRDNDEKLDVANTQIRKLNEENEKVNNENINLSKQLKGCQARIEEEEELLSKLKAELEKSTKQLLEYEAEVIVLKEQRESLSCKVKDEKNRSSLLEKQKNSLQQAVNDAMKREKAAQDEIRVSNDRIEVARTELRALYQGQLETVVKEKLQEFQSQLEAAEASLKAELHSKEKQWAEKANDHCRQLQGKHKQELQQVEESCREEINKWKVRLVESERLRINYENRLQEETNRRADIAQKLHSVMETQWREALNIISNPIQNACEIAQDENRSRWPSHQQSSERLKGGGDRKVSRSNSATSLAQAEEVPFCKEGLVTYRMSQPPPQDHQLKKYIQMLLERGPGNPIPQHDTLESVDQQFSPESSLLINNRDSEKMGTGQVERLGQPSKPPWK